MRFDVGAARKAGYSYDEIADFLAKQNSFDIDAARKSGYSAEEVVGFLSDRQPKADPVRSSSPVIDEPIQYDDAATAMQGSASTEARPRNLGKSEYKSVLEGYRAPAQSRFNSSVAQSDIDSLRRELGGVKPAERRDVLSKIADSGKQGADTAEALRREVEDEDARNASLTYGKKNTIDLLAQNPMPEEKPGVGPRRGGGLVSFPQTRSIEGLFEGLSVEDEINKYKATNKLARASEVIEQVPGRRDELIAEEERRLQSEARSRFAEENPILGSLASGAASSLSGAINIPSVAADFLNQAVINPVLRATGLKELERAPTMFGTEYLNQAASEFLPRIGKASMTGASDRGQLGEFLVSKLAANSLPVAQSLMAAFVPALRPVLLPSMGGVTAGQSFAEGDDSRVAMAKGALEIATEFLPLGVFDKIGDALRGMNAAKSNTILAVAGQRLLQSGVALTGNTVTNAVEEVAAQFGGNVLDKYFQGKDIELTKQLDEAAALGGLTGGLMSAPQVAAASFGAYDSDVVKREKVLLQALGGDGQLRDAGDAAIDFMRVGGSGGGSVRPESTSLQAAAAEGRRDLQSGNAAERFLADAGLLEGERVRAITAERERMEQMRRTAPASIMQSGSVDEAIDTALQATQPLPDAPQSPANPVQTPANPSVTPFAGVQTPMAGVAAGLGSSGDQVLGNVLGALGNLPTAAAAPAVDAAPEIETGRRGDGYATMQDARQALAFRLENRPELDWSIEPDGERFVLVGRAKGASDVGTPSAPVAGVSGIGAGRGTDPGSGLALDGRNSAAGLPGSGDANGVRAPDGGAFVGTDGATPAGNAGAVEPIVLQNRDRSSAASVSQMNSIAANPDYLRAGPSREMVTGAPVVFGDTPASAVVGRQETVTDGRGQRIGVQYAVVEATDLIASNQADGTPVPEYQSGAAGKMRAVAGNGRTAGLQEAYNRGTTRNYQAELLADLPNVGIDAAAVQGMKRPVLVRVMSQSDVTADIGDRTNTAVTQNLSAVEQAANDTRRIDVSALEFTDAGDPTPAAIRSFVFSLPESEQGNLLNRDGTPTRQAVDRIMAATFKAAYGDDGLVQLYAQATDPDARAVINAAAMSAGSMARLADAAPEFDIRGVVSQAIGIAVNASRQGVKVGDFAANRDMTVDDAAADIARFIGENIRSPKKMAEGLRRMAELAAQQQAILEDNASNMGMFGDQPTANRQEIISVLFQVPGQSQVASADARVAQDGSQGSQRGATDPAGAGGVPSQSTGGSQAAADGAGQAQGLTAPTREDVLAQQDRAANAGALDQRDQIRRESEAGAGLFSLEMQDGRVDDAGDLFGASSPQASTRDASNDQDGDYLDALFGAGSSRGASASSVSAPDLNPRGLRDSVAAAISETEADINDWETRQYKGNRARVELRGDGPSNQESLSIGSINEGRRTKVLTSLREQRAGLQSLSARMGTDAGAKSAMAEFVELYDQTAADVARGTFTVSKDVDAEFEYRLLSRMGGSASAGRGSVASNKLSKTVLAAVKAAKANLANDERLTPVSKRTKNQDPTYSTGDTFAVKDGGQTFNVRVLDNSAIGKAGPVLQVLAQIFGKRIVVIDPNGLNTDGFVRDGDNTNIFIDRNSGINPVAVFFHELTHLIAREMPEVFAALQAVVERNLKTDALDRFQDDYGGPARNYKEELISDLVGNRIWRDPGLLGEVLAEVAAQNPDTARAAILKFAAYVTKAVDAAVRALRQQGFTKTDPLVKNLQEVKDAVKTALVEYAKEQGISAAQVEVAMIREGSKADLTASPRRADRTLKRKSPQDFIKAPDGSLNFGEITAEMARAMGREAGLIRLRRGDRTWGLVHIEQRHGQDFAALGYSGAQEFIALVAKNFTKIFRGNGAALNVVIDDGARGMLIVSLEPSADGAYYDIKTATPIRSKQFSEVEPLWERTGPSASVADGNPPSPRGQSGNTSVPNAAADGNGPDGRVEKSPKRSQEDRQSDRAQRISPRLPTAVKATENPMGELRLQPDLATAMRDQQSFAHNIDLMASYPNFSGLKGAPAQMAEAMIGQMQSNLVWLYQNWKPEFAQRSQLWYVGGNRIATRWADRFGLPSWQVAAVIAATSPQKDWFQNVSLAERILEAVVNNSTSPWTDEMSATVNSRDWGGAASRDLGFTPRNELNRLRGKTLRDLFDPDNEASLLDMAVWVRAWDETYNPMMARVISPEGAFIDEFDSAKSGKPIGLRWQSFATIAKTLQILQAQNRDDVSRIIGANHKVRSFFNNIIAPFAGEDVTIDTHAVAAALLRPLGSSATEVAHNFGTNEKGQPGPKNSSITGLYGTYAIYAEAYRRAAQQMGVLPREMQSVTWEAVRGLFRPEQKNARIKAEADAIWTSFAQGGINAATARQQILELVQGIQDPAWVRSPAGANEAARDSSYEAGVSGNRVPGRGAQSAATGSRDGSARDVPTGGQDLSGVTQSRKRIATDPTSANFKRWSYNAPLITSAAAETHVFRTGQPVAVEGYHGTGRGDRVGVVFRRDRATSGPMAFFTSSAALASSYAQGKADTSLSLQDNPYESWIKFTAKGMRSPVSIDRAWYLLDQSTKQLVASRLPDIRTDDDGNIIYEEGGGDIGSYDWELKQTKTPYLREGNPLKAAVETWLSSGALFGDEQQFMRVLRLAGMPMSQVAYDSPQDSFPFVYKVYISMRQPLVTNDVPAEVEQALKAAAAKDRSRPKYQNGVDSWDKNTRTLKEWVNEYLNPSNGDNKYVWTSIPDKVTEVFKSLGYDGIIDWSGKGGGGEVAPVYIPFEEVQVKSAISNTGEFDRSKKDITASRKRAYNSPDGYTTDLFGNPLPGAQGGAAGAEQSAPASSRDMDAAAGLRADPPQGNYATRTQLVTTRQQKLGAKVILTLEDSANALAYLNRSAVERFDAIVTDKAGRPLAVVGGFKGERTQASVYPATVLSEAILVPGAANLWLVHNHPSERSDLSSADRNLAQMLRNVFDGTGIEVRGMVAVTGDSWSGAPDSGFFQRDETGTLSPVDGPTVPAQERELIERGKLGPALGGPSDAKRVVLDLVAANQGRPTIVLLDAGYSPLAAVPWAAGDAMPLKGNGKLDALYRAVAASNAYAAIIGLGDKNPMSDAQAMNIGAALKKVDTQVLDIVPQSGPSFAERGKETAAKVLMSRKRQTETPQFKRWFKDSAIVDADGNPMVVYHATTKKFTAFIPSWAPGWGTGIYLTDNREQARDEFGDGKDSNVLDVYVSMQNPWREEMGYGVLRIEESKAWADYVKSKGKRLPEDPDYDEWDDGISLEDVLEEDANLINDVIRERGYDGIIANSSNGINGLEIVAFYPEQIKSASQNNGDFDPVNPDMNASRKRKAEVVSEYFPANDLELRDGSRREFSAGPVRLTVDVQDGVASASLEANEGAQRGTGAATNLYMTALQMAQNGGIAWGSEGVLSSSAIRMYERLRGLGIPFSRKEDYPYFISAEALADVAFDRDYVTDYLYDSLVESGLVDGDLSASRKRTPLNYISERDDLGKVRFGLGSAIYRQSADIANVVLDKLAMKPISPELSKAMTKMKTEIERAKEKTADVAKAMSALSESERQMISDIIEGELQMATVPSRRVLEIASALQQIMSNQTAELKRLGMISDETANRWDGKYLPRFYEQTLGNEMTAWAKAVKELFTRPRSMLGIGGKNLKSRGLWETIPADELDAWIDEGWEVRDPDYDENTSTEVRIWRDYTRQERENMGEIRDAMFRFVMGYNRAQRDISLGKLFEEIASTMASKTEQEGYVQVPKTVLQDAISVNTYGKLAGKWVPKEVLDHLSAFDATQRNGLIRFYQKALSYWKEGKVVLNPVSHANNILSNLTMAHFAGVSYFRADKYALAMRDLVKNSSMVQEAKDAGLFTGTFNQAELAKQLPEELRVYMQQSESQVARRFDQVWTLLTYFLRKPMAKAYEMEDQYFRFLLYKEARERGLSPEDAVAFSTDHIFNYDDLPKGARVVRDTALPFFAYTYKVTPVLARTALEYPHRFAMPAFLLYAVNEIFYAMAAGDEEDDWKEIIARYFKDAEFRERVGKLEDEERKNLPPWLQGASASLGTPKAIRLGKDEATNLPVFLDVSKIFPGGDLLDLAANAGGVPFPQPLTPSSPVLSAAAVFLFNKDPFFGKDVVDQNDNAKEAAMKRAEWAWKQFSPAIALGNYHYDRVMNVIAQTTGEDVLGYTGRGKDGIPVDPAYSAMQTFGIKARPIDLEKSADIREGQERKLIRSIEAEIRQLQRLEERGAITSKRADEQIQKERDKIEAMREKVTNE